MAISRYHWTFDYLIWGISYTNLTMMLNDSIQVFYDSDRKGDEKQTFDANDPKSIHLMRAFLKK